MKDIPNFSRYCVDLLGNLYSKNYKNTGKMKVLKPALNDGYLKTMLQDDSGKSSTKSVHRIAALAFFGEPNGLHVNHKNGIKSDNSIENLEYVTISENIIHAYKNNLLTPKRGALNGMSKLTAEQVTEIREHAAKCQSRYYGREELAKKYGVSVATIKDIVTKRRNSWIGA